MGSGLLQAREFSELQNEVVVLHVSLGSLLTPKGEDSEEDEDTEYFDAMEDSTSFITVITEAKEDRWVLQAGLLPLEGASRRVSLPRLVLLTLYLFFVLGAFFQASLQIIFWLDLFCFSFDPKCPNSV